MTALACVGNTGSKMVRIICPVICVDMAGGTCRWRSAESACVTGAAKAGSHVHPLAEAVIMVEGSAVLPVG